MNNENTFLSTFFRSAVANPEKLEAVMSCFQQRQIDKNCFLLEEGNVSNEYFILESGLARAYSIDIQGNEVTTAFFVAGKPVFEVASFFLRQESKESIQAITPCVVWSISFEELNRLFHGIPEFREFGRSLLVQGFAELKLRMQSVITETAEVRYLKLIESSSEIIKYAPLKYIASYLGVTDSSLSRIRKDTAFQTTKKVN